MVPGEFLTAPRELEKLDDGVQVLVGAARSRQGGLPQLFGPSGSVPDRPQHLGHRGSPGEFPGGPAEQEPERPDAFGLGAGEGLQQFRPAEALPEQVAGVRVPGPGGKQGPDQRALSHRVQFAEGTGQQPGYGLVPEMFEVRRPGQPGQEGFHGALGSEGQFVTGHLHGDSPRRQFAGQGGQLAAPGSCDHREFVPGAAVHQHRLAQRGGQVGGFRRRVVVDADRDE